MPKPSIPNWLKQLPSGLYSLNQLVNVSGSKHKTSVQRTLKRLGVPRYIGEKIYKNIVETKYEWKNPEQ